MKKYPRIITYPLICNACKGELENPELDIDFLGMSLTVYATCKTCKTSVGKKFSALVFIRLSQRAWECIDSNIDPAVLDYDDLFPPLYKDEGGEDEKA